MYQADAILYDETIRQQTNDGIPFLKILTEAGTIPGIKVDTGAKDLAGRPGEKITEGLDGLRDRLLEYFQMGARFAKWPAVIALGDGLPSYGCIEANAQALARYAALCQEAGLVPIVEPEVLMAGEHTLEQCRQVTEATLRSVFDHLCTQGVMLEGMILKPNMVLPGLSSPKQQAVDEVAAATVGAFLRVVPAAVPGIAFLSGGQAGELASARLNAMNVMAKSPTSRLPRPAGVFVCACDLTAKLLRRFGGGQGLAHSGGTGCTCPSSALQRGRTLWRIFLKPRQ